MVSRRPAVAAAPLVSVAVTVNGQFLTRSPPLAVAAEIVPDSTPPADSVSPGGSEPAVTAHRSAPLPPAVVSRAEYGRETCADGSVGVVTIIPAVVSHSR